MNVSFTSLTRLLRVRVFRGGLLVALALFAGISSNAQQIICESFDATTYPPTGWTTLSSGPSFNRVTAGSFPSQLPHTGAGEIQFNSFSVSSGTAELRTPVLSFTATGTKQVNFWMYRDNGYLSTPDHIDVYVNTTASATGGTLLGTVNRASNLAPVVSANGWYPYTFNVPATFNTATNYIIFKGTTNYGNDIYMDDICVINLAPCSSLPTAGTTVPTGIQAACPGTAYNLTTTGTTIAGNLTYQWMQSTNGGTTWVPATGTNPTSLNYTTSPINVTTLFHVVVTCSITGQKDSTTNVTFTVTPPTYAPVPYTQDFEVWQNGCNTSDVPGTEWTNVPATGDASWRREDQGATANWTSPTSGAYTPASAHGLHSARFHSYYANSAKGTFSLYLNCSGITAPLELQTYMITYNYVGCQDSVDVYLSTNGGATFNTTPVAMWGPGNGTWQYKNVLFTSSSAQTVLKFVGSGGTYWGDLGLDYLRVLPPCSGKPTAGAVQPVQPCPNANFTLQLTGTSQAAGLTYQWQYLNASNVWTNIAAGNTQTVTYNINAPTSVRAIVTCSNSTQADTTAPYLVTLAPFYYCYCASAGQFNYSGFSFNIGNVTINKLPNNVTILNNGVATPLINNANAVQFYTDYRYTVNPVPVFRDSLYRSFFTEIDAAGFYGSTVSSWIDYNRNGTFDNNERLWTQNIITSNTTHQVNDTFRIPHTAQIGITGYRVILVYGTGAAMNPCGTYSYGETEDYLMNIQYPPCNGPTNAGTAIASDTVVCPGYTIDLTDSTHEHQKSGLLWSWQVSTNGGASFTHITGSNGKDTLNNVLITGPAQFRLRIICSNSGDTTYSNIVNISNGAPYQCYAYSQASGNKAQDSSDIGTFSIGKYISPIGYITGPHINNPLAVRRRTDNTKVPIILNADSTYHMSIYHTMSSKNHADARASVFIDFNNDLQYNALGSSYPYGPERIYTGVTSASDWYLDTMVTMPDAVIPETPTGLRVILNNDVNPSSPANMGAGAYVSGETEDYVVIFHRYNPTLISATGLIRDMIMYPNPSEGRFTLGINSSKDIAQMNVVVSTLTGQTVINRSFSHTGTQFNTDLDLTGQARGVYFVEVRADGDRIIRKLVIR